MVIEYKRTFADFETVIEDQTKIVLAVDDERDQRTQVSGALISTDLFVGDKEGKVSDSELRFSIDNKNKGCSSPFEFKYTEVKVLSL